MMVRAFGFWPFTMEPGPDFLYVFVGMCVVVLGAARLAQQLIGRSRAPERSSAASASRAALPVAGGLAVGELPRDTDAPAIAYLRGGHGALVETLLGQALAEGWLTKKDGSPALLADAAPRDVSMRMLLDELGKRKLDVEGMVTSARVTASRLEPTVRAKLEEAGLLRTLNERVFVAAAPLAGAATLVLFAFARVAVRDARFGDAPFPANLFGAVFVACAASVVLALTSGRATPLGRRYLKFVEDASTALRERARAVRGGDPTGVPLAVALEGMRAVGWLPLAGAVVAITSPMPGPSGSDGSGGFSSSCSSGGSSSGGSSCGSSCGGGGGCS